MPDPDNLGSAGLTFLLNEFRDLRKGMETRDGALRTSIDGVRSDVKELAISVYRSRGDVDAIRNSMVAVKEDLHVLRKDLDEVQNITHAEKIRNESSWSGPKRLSMIIILLASVATSILVLANFAPKLLAFLIPA